MALNEGFLDMTARLAEMALLLSSSISGSDEGCMNRCEMLVHEALKHEKALTREVVIVGREGDLIKSLMHLPFRFGRIAEKLEEILSCLRVKGTSGILFGRKAEADIQQLLAILADMVSNLRDAFSVPDRVLVESIVSEGTEMNGSIRGLRSARWLGPEESPLGLQGTSLYLDILDAIKSASEDLGSICKDLLQAEIIFPASPHLSDTASSGSCG